MPTAGGRAGCLGLGPASPPESVRCSPTCSWSSVPTGHCYCLWFLPHPNSPLSLLSLGHSPHFLQEALRSSHPSWKEVRRNWVWLADSQLLNRGICSTCLSWGLRVSPPWALPWGLGAPFCTVIPELHRGGWCRLGDTGPSSAQEASRGQALALQGHVLLLNPGLIPGPELCTQREQ